MSGVLGSATGNAGQPACVLEPLFRGCCSFLLYALDELSIRDVRVIAASLGALLGAPVEIKLDLKHLHRITSLVGEPPTELLGIHRSLAFQSRMDPTGQRVHLRDRGASNLQEGLQGYLECYNQHPGGFGRWFQKELEEFDSN